MFGYKLLMKQPTRVTTESQTLIYIFQSNIESVVALTDAIILSLPDDNAIDYVRKINHLKYEYFEIKRAMILKNCAANSI